jgi:mono/diheme cytochrome c family protein
VKAAAVRHVIFRALLTAAGVGLLGVVLVTGQQPTPPPVFTEAQASAGRTDYASQCASCHMPDLSGNIEIPALAGKPFKDSWGKRSTKELVDYMSAAMPYGAPSLSMESYLAITAYILQFNGAPAGPDALTASTAVAIGSVAASTGTPLDNARPASAR